MTTSTNQKERLRHLESRQRELERRMAAAERELERLRSSTERRFDDATRELHRLDVRINASSQNLDGLKSAIFTTALISALVVYFVALIILVAVRT